jgi:hypothetical protein
MTAFTHTYGEHAAITSINKWFSDNIGTSKPSWMTSATVNFDYPRIPLVYPSFSVTHFGGADFSVAEGDYVETASGTRYRGVKRLSTCEVSCWVTRLDNPNWQRDVRQMADMVSKLLHGTRSIPMVDAYASLAALGTIVRVTNVERTNVAPDQGNANVERARFVVTYTWIERWEG